MKVFCPTHKRRFTTDAVTPIVCEREGGHVLGSAPNDPATKNLWAYCCNCANFIPLNPSGVADGSCPVCDREITGRFLCEHCRTLSFESSESAKNKEFRLTEDGVPKPYCAGCLKSTKSKLRDHECESFAASYKTPRDTCPFCAETLAAPPSFPSSVSKLIEDIQESISPLEFDAESNQLHESRSGNYVFVSPTRNSSFSMVIPKAPRFNTRRDYYDTYQELFNCDNPIPGEVIILAPAMVEKSENGWTLREPGNIEVNPDSGSKVAAATIKCASCGAFGSRGRAFCKRCGSAMNQVEPASAATPGYSDQAVETFHANIGASGHSPTLTAAPAPSTSQTDVVPPSDTSKPKPNAGVRIGLGVAAGVVFLIVIIVVAATMSGSSVEGKLDNAITKRNLFGSSSDNAYALYYQLKNSGASEETMKRYREKLTPVLTTHGEQLINGLMQLGYDEPDASEWQDAAKNLDWAAELNPGNSSMAARAAYCNGRVAFLQKRYDQALTPWTRAADLDKSWVLPVNGIGMVYTSKRDFGTARSYFFQALQRDSNWPFPYENIGNAYWEEKDFGHAKEFYQKALEKAPNWAKPHYHLAYMALDAKDYPTAVTEFDAALDSNAKGLKGVEVSHAQRDREKAQRLSGR